MPEKVGPFAGEQFEPDEASDRTVRGTANVSPWDAQFGIVDNGADAVLDGRAGFSSREGEEAAAFWSLTQTLFLYNPWEPS